MLDVFDGYAPKLIQREGSIYTNRAADLGGPTKYGITAAKLGEWRKLGRPATQAEVHALQLAEALQIYRTDFFVRPGFDRIATVSARIAEELLDTGVNMGPEWPAGWLQEILNLCNRRGEDYPDLVVDRGIGPKTVAALGALLLHRGHRVGEDLVLKCLNGEQYARYKAITLAGGPNGPQEENFCGWIIARVGFV